MNSRKIAKRLSSLNGYCFVKKLQFARRKWEIKPSRSSNTQKGTLAISIFHFVRFQMLSPNSINWFHNMNLLSNSPLSSSMRKKATPAFVNLVLTTSCNGYSHEMQRFAQLSLNFSLWGIIYPSENLCPKSKCFTQPLVARSSTERNSSKASFSLFSNPHWNYGICNKCCCHPSAYFKANTLSTQFSQGFFVRKAA